jgi:hypothetical protein
MVLRREVHAMALTRKNDPGRRAPRPKRSERVHFSYAALSNFKIEPPQWEVLETAYGRQLSEIAKGEIVQACRRFLEQLSAEHRAVEKKEFAARLEQIKLTARELRKLLFPDDTSDLSVICSEIALSPLTGSLSDEDLLAAKIDVLLDHKSILKDHLSEIAQSCERQMRTDDDSGGGFRGGAEIDRFRNELETILKKHGLPTGIANDSTLITTADGESPYVEFYLTLQGLFSDDPVGSDERPGESLANEKRRSVVGLKAALRRSRKRSTKPA